MRKVKLPDIIFSLPFPLVVCDKEGKVCYFNQKFEMLINKSEKYIENRRLSDILKDKTIEKWINKCVNEGIEIHNLTVKEFSFSLSPIYSEEKIAGVSIIITPKKEEKAENFDVFLKGISHELRNPLGGIKAAAKFMLTTNSLDEELLEVILSEIGRIERFLDRICESFDFSRLKWSKINIHELLDAVVRTFSPQLKEKNIELKTYFDPSLPEVIVDKDRIFQVISNIIKNAIEAVENCEKREIILKTGYAIQPKGFIYIKIIDTGIGMEQEELENLFTPFFTVNKENGTGLGMYIAKEIIHHHGGKIDVKSEKGKGTEVTIFLPIGAK